jgi:uncharacterized repeat protein (TIGR03803 family)
LIKPTGEEKILYGFKGMGSGDGANPSGGVIFEKHGALYGTTEFGGLHGYGTVFSLTPSRSGYAEHVLYGFGATSNNGAYPTAGVVVGKDGALYGTTSSGGVNNCGRHVRAGCGTIFELSRSGSGYSERVLHYFGGGYEGGLPYGGVIFGLNGVLYGTTETGGASRAGTVFSIKP